MSTVTAASRFTLNGKSAFKVGSDLYGWSNNWLMAVDAWADPAGATRNVTVTLSGDDWNIGTLRFSDALKVTIKDSAAGSGRYLTHLFLNASGGTTASFASTHVATIAGSEAAEKITLGAGGSEAVFLFGGNDAVTTGAGYVGSINAGTGKNSVTTGSGDVGSIIAYEGNDTIKTGSGNVGSIHAGAGDNVITIGTGSVDSVIAYGGNDKLTISGTNYVGSIHLGSGNNTIKTGGAEVASITTLGGNDTVTTGAGAVTSIALGAGNNRLTTGSGEVTSVTTSSGIDRITLGSGGAQTIATGSNDDTVIFNPLTDAYKTVIANGGSGEDTASFASFKTAITASLAGGGEIDTGQGIFQLAGFENLTGGAAADALTGSSRNNVLKGGAGNDELTGLGGADHLYGGAGADVFIFRSVTESTVDEAGRDTIFDFTKSDRIDLSAIDANTGVSGDQSFDFIGKAAFSGTAGELRYEKAASDTYIYGDVNGDGEADFAIHLDDALTFKAGYFLL